MPKARKPQASKRRAPSKPVVHAVISHYECVGAGSLEPKGWFFTATSESEAEDYFQKKFEHIRGSMDWEVEIIQSNPRYEFDSPYIGWVLWLAIPKSRMPAESTQDYLPYFAEMFSTDHPLNVPVVDYLAGVCQLDSPEPTTVLRQLVREYRGATFSPEESQYPLDEALNAVAEYFYQ